MKEEGLGEKGKEERVCVCVCVCVCVFLPLPLEDAVAVLLDLLSLGGPDDANP